MKRFARTPFFAIGVVIPLWLLAGVSGVGHFYPGYDHLNMAMSLLGAEGAPTGWFSPLINNFPLGVLFILFGLAVAGVARQSRLTVLSGGLLVLHGLASFGTGAFSCDAGCSLEAPSLSQQLHNLFGLVMALSLLLASALWVWLARRELHDKSLSWLSLGCTLVALVALPLMAEAVKAGHDFGLWQRINYGASVLWVGILGWRLALGPQASARPLPTLS